MCDKAGCIPGQGEIIKVFNFLHLNLCETHRKELYDVTVEQRPSEYVDFVRYKEEVDALNDVGQFPPDTLWERFIFAKSAFWVWIKVWLNAP